MSNEYLNHIRTNSAYPVFRSFVSIVASICVVLSIILGLSGLLAGGGAFVVTAILGAFLYVLIKIAVEVSLILADTADATVERSSRDWIKPTTVSESIATNTNTNTNTVNQQPDEKLTQNDTETVQCPKCGWENFSDSKKCVSCKAEI